MLPAHIAFTAPWLLGFLVALPLLWWLLRLTPPTPHTVVFPALMLLRNLIVPENVPARTPWWLLILRLIIAALLIVGMAQPLIDPLPTATHQSSLLLVIDNDWASARDWGQRKQILEDIVHEATREHRSVTLLSTTPSGSGEALANNGSLTPELAATRIQSLVPHPWPADWIQAAKVVRSTQTTDIIWLSSGLGGNDVAEFYDALQQTAAVRVIATKNPIYVLQPPQGEDAHTDITVLRPDVDNSAEVTVDALSQDGNVLAHLPMSFKAGSPRATANLLIPLDIRNQIMRFEIEGQHSAAGTVLMDSAWERRPVGLVGDAAELEQHSLLSSLLYIDRALKPFADIHIAPLSDLLKANMSVVILSDTTMLNDSDVQSLKDWMKSGGMLVRFAGEHLASSVSPAEADIIPVTLRSGDRTLGGALSWATPQKLQAFSKDSVFQSLNIPDDVVVSRQVLAEPSTDLVLRTWAALQDGTPLVTAKKIGQGVSILFHISARADWSNLPLSGLFVDMLHRLVDLSRGIPQLGVGTAFSTLPPLHMLNAFGEYQNPEPTAHALTADDARLTPSFQHPPGLYGTNNYHLAFNLGTNLGQPEALQNIPIETFNANRHEISLEPYLLTAAFLLLLIDFIISLFMRGLVTSLPIKISAIVFFLVTSFIFSSAVAANTINAVDLTAQTTLAYIQTGNRDVDAVSASGLKGLARTLERRTSLDHVAVAAVDPNENNLAFFPLIYWPLLSGTEPLSPDGIAHVNTYLHRGGMILFDAMNDEDPSPVLLKKTLRGVDMPLLVHLPENHVLKRSFYLLDEFPGRFSGHEFWLEPEDASSYDGVATVLYGSNAWAAAWAKDEQGRPLYPCMPNGEIQRERAFRFGVNLVMYALTGNYKADQLHVKGLLDKMDK